MRINRHLIPLKVHNFLFQGCLVPIIPFIIILAMQLGIPVSVQGTIAAASLLITVICKPLIAGLADTYPSYRKAIFLVTLTIMVSSYSSIWFIPPLSDTPVLKGQLVRAVTLEEVSSQLLPAGSGTIVQHGNFSSGLLLLVHQGAGCYISVAEDCIESCSGPESCVISNTNHSSIQAEEIDMDTFHRVVASPSESFATGISHMNNQSWNAQFQNVSVLFQNVSVPVTDSSQIGHLYELEGVVIPSTYINKNISLICATAEWSGKSCKKSWNHWEFWIYVLLLNIAQITFNTGNSITDAIAVDSIGENGNYGMQRAWGSLGWGVVGTVSGLLVDLWSGSSIIKDYTPAFLICFILGSLDIFTCASTLKVPQIGDSDSNVLKLIGPLLHQPRFFISCFFVLFNGCFDGIVTNFLFVLQDSMAQRTNSLSYLTFLQGFSLLIQCATEAPFMFAYEWFVKKLGTQRVLSFVFFTYMLRMFGLCIVGHYGPVWSSLVVELLNGPCFGLGYTVTVGYAALIAPPGTSTTVQSILNICFDNLGYALANIIGGILIDVMGAPGMFMVAGFIAATIFLLHLLSTRFFPPPEEQVKQELNTLERTKDDGTVEEQTALNGTVSEETNNCIHPGDLQTEKETICIPGEAKRDH